LEDIADTVPGAQLIMLQDRGDLIELEQEDQYLQIASSAGGVHSVPLAAQLVS